MSVDRSCCPHPEKLGFYSKRHAKRFLRRSHHRRDEMRVYRCACSLFHLAHKTPRSRRAA